MFTILEQQFALRGDSAPISLEFVVPPSGAVVFDVSVRIRQSKRNPVAGSSEPLEDAFSSSTSCERKLTHLRPGVHGLKITPINATRLEMEFLFQDQVVYMWTHREMLPCPEEKIWLFDGRIEIRQPM